MQDRSFFFCRAIRQGWGKGRGHITQPLLAIDRLALCAKTRRGSLPLVRALSFSIDAGEPLAMVGESGSGKTMTGLALLGLLPHDIRAEGTVQVAGRTLSSIMRRAQCGRALCWIPQYGADCLTPTLRVHTQLWETLRKQGVRGAQMRETACALLERAGFSDPDAVLPRYPHQLSGGMAQRVVLAMALSAAPQVVVADEPTRGLDEAMARRFLPLMTEAFAKSALLLITHSLAIARTCPRVLVLYGGVEMECGATDAILERPLHPYTRALLQALPEAGFAGASDAPASIPEGTGCPYAMRCAEAQERCFTVLPALRRVSGAWRRCHNV